MPRRDYTIKRAPSGLFFMRQSRVGPKVSAFLGKPFGKGALGTYSPVYDPRRDRMDEIYRPIRVQKKKK